MDSIDFKHDGPGSGFQLEGFPDGIKVVHLTDGAAKRVSDLALHMRDLSFAEDCMRALATEPRALVRDALWRMSVILLVKCFDGSDARVSLASQKVYQGLDIAKECFAWFKDLRNKHIAHDVNSYTSVATGAVVNCPGAPCKIAKVVTLSLLAETIEQDNYSNLMLLIEHASRWVRAQYEQCCQRITNDLESKSHEALMSLPNLEVKKPGEDDIAHGRRT